MISGWMFGRRTLYDLAWGLTGSNQWWPIWCFDRKALGVPKSWLSYFCQLIDGADDVQQTSFSSSWIPQDDNELALPNIDSDTPECGHTLKSEQVGFMYILP